MTEHEKYQEHIRHTHDAFCKTVIRHAAIDAARSISKGAGSQALSQNIFLPRFPFSEKWFIMEKMSLLQGDRHENPLRQQAAPVQDPLWNPDAGAGLYPAYPYSHLRPDDGGHLRL